MSEHLNPQTLVKSPFSLANDSAYHQWREQKSAYLQPDVAALMVAIENPYQLSDDEKAAVTERCQHFNMALYQLSDSTSQDKALVHALGKQLALQRLDSNLRADEDSVSSVEVREQAGNQYIPYTNKALSWHTDGYYNPLEKQIYGFIIHCVRPAVDGGINTLCDPENIYIALRDESSAYIEALMHPQAMTIPANIEADEVIRDEQAGPVFMVKPNGELHMRFSARKRNIIWRDTAETKSAVAMINEIITDEKNVVTVGLKAGQGLVCNNVLHNRSGFTDGDNEKRLMYRARYYDAVARKIN